MESYKMRAVVIAIGIMIFMSCVLGSSSSYASENREQVLTVQNESLDSLEEEGEIPAEEGEGVISDDDPNVIGSFTRAISSVSASFSRLSSTSAKAIVIAKGTASVKTMKSTITLQKKNKSTGKYATVSGTTRTKTVSGRSLTHAPTYSIQSGQNYRIKCIVSDGKSNLIKYTNLQ